MPQAWQPLTPLFLRPVLRKEVSSRTACVRVPIENEKFANNKDSIAPKMPQCHAYKANHQLCGANVNNDLGMCFTHINQQAGRVHRSGPRPEGTCEEYLRTNRWCGQPQAPGNRRCMEHHLRADIIIARDNERNADQQRVRDFVNARPILTWQEVLDRVFLLDGLTPGRRHTIAFQYFLVRPNIQHVPNFTARWQWIINGRQGAEPIEVPREIIQPPLTPQPQQQHLALIANDRQNVHTRHVTEQTNSALEKILKANVPKTQATQSNMTFVWLYDLPEAKRPKFNQYLAVITDVHKWFATKTCRTQNDQLYYRTLRGLVALINEKPAHTRTELYIRLWEECCEAVDMCCDGHITRLCNVLVGFDDEFKPQVPFGELLQNKMSAIARSDASDEEKRNQANAFFDEHAIPEAERNAWLEAF